ncbi:MAG: hypothetical protein KDA42_08630 [Planctomycetales bacterium]|nr:hypothetical protein [Planctomycetales bacterium]
MTFRVCSALAVLLFAAYSFADEATRAYRIGNSLTWDSQPKAIEALAAQHGEKHTQAYHINCGKSLERIWTHPEEICVNAVEPFGTFGHALPNYEWQAITFQPHPGADSTLASDTARVLDLIGKSREAGKNRAAVFYIYAPWPGQKLGAFHEVWTQETADADDTKTIQTRAYFAHLLRRVRDKTDADVRLIPAGHVVAELDRRMREGQIAGYASAADLYRDVVHLNHVGRFAAGVTTYATIFRRNPAGMTCPANQYGGGQDFSPELYGQIHSAVWKVIQSMPEETGVPN